MNLFVPQANSIQTGTRKILHIINEDDITEGDFFNLSAEDNRQTTNSFVPPKFLELFWFFNPKASSKKNELDLVTFSINLNFGNLRINGYLDAKTALHNHALFLSKDLLTINAAIYPTGLYHLRNLQNCEDYTPIEQLFVEYSPETDPWHDELPKTEFLKRNDKLKMNIWRNQEEKFNYVFQDKQYYLFNYSLDYILTNGFTIIGNNKFK